MKRHLYSYLLLLTLVFSVAAQKSAVVETGAPAERLRQHVEYLASGQLEGRRTGQPGATTAAGYIANMFAKYRLKPGSHLRNGKPSYMQSFPYVTGVEMSKTGNAFALQLAGDSSERLSIHPQVKPVGFSPNGSVEGAPIVFAGFGIATPDGAFDDYKKGGKDLDVRGKVVLIFDGSPENDNPHSAFGRIDLRTKALIAKEKGAVGVFVISREQDLKDDKLSRLVYDQTLGEAAVPVIVVSRETARSILVTDANGLAELEKAVASKSDDAAVPARDVRATVSFKIDLVKKQAEAYNVIGILEGTDKTLKSEAIVIGAHYDHLGRGGQGSLAANSTDIHHGADDNASGTAAILELARTLAADKKNKRTIIFMAFSGEEEGLLGSKFYVNNPVFPIEKTVAMINLDMVGRLNNNKLNVGGIGSATELRPIVEKWNANGTTATTGAGTASHTVKVSTAAASNKFELALNEDGFGPSDHASFYGKKIPVLFFFTGTHADYHKPSDTSEKINFAGLDAIRGYVLNIVRDIDRSASRPTYTVAKSSGMGGGRTGFNVSLGTIPSYADATDGMVLDGVRDNSPASKAGLKEGDKIIKLAGRDIRNVMDYTYTLGEMKADEEYEVVVMRGTERLTLKIVPAKR